MQLQKNYKKFKNQSIKIMLFTKEKFILSYQNI